MIINGKLAVPAQPRLWVQRPALTARLDELIGTHHVTWVCAAAGAGKTTAVADALRSAGTPVAWLTLDRSDLAPGHLLSYLEAALSRALPVIGSRAADALAAGAGHLEATGLLADAVGSHGVTLVLDRFELLADSPSPLAVVSTFIRYASVNVHVVLLSRRELSLDLDSASAVTNAVRVGDGDLAFSVAEAQEAIALRGAIDIDADAVVAATGGWVTAVLFGAFGPNGMVCGAGGDVNPLHGYLSAQILADLSTEQRAFLVTTALCDEVTVERARALGIEDSGRVINELRRLHLPALWDVERRSLTLCAPLREYLLEILESGPESRVRQVRRSYAELLRDEDRLEEATDVLIEMGELSAALAVSERALPDVLRRLDLSVAERWISALTPQPGGSSTDLMTADLMVAVGREDYARGAAVADRIVELMGANAAYPGDLGGLMAICFWLTERYEDASAALDRTDDRPVAKILTWANEVERVDGHERYQREPAADGGPADAIPQRLHWTHGRLRRLLDPHPSPWVEAVHHPWRLMALLALGRLEEAVELDRRARDVGISSMFLECFARVELLLETGHASEAWRQHIVGRERVAASGSGFFKALHLALEAKLALRLRRDPDQARAALDQVEHFPAGREVQHVVDEHAVWKGLTLLYENHNHEATVLLRSTSRRLIQRDRLLQLPLVAVYLSEAEWRLGNEEFADAAAELALNASDRLGSHHRLLSALRDFPDVAARQVDREQAPGGAWHRLSGTLLRPKQEAGEAAGVVLHEFGAAALEVDGERVRPRIAKSVELAAFLLNRSQHRASRDELLGALFGGRADSSARSYLRQAINRLREVLPDGELLHSSPDAVWLEPGCVSSEAQHFLRALTAATEATDGEQLPALLAALDIPRRGVFLDGVASRWVEERRAEIEDAVTDAHMRAAELALGGGAYAAAQESVAAVLAVDPYREHAWQIRMRVLHALGRSDAIVATYRECELSLSTVGLSASPSTRRLVEQLRR